jgi:hypothetical protein
MDCICPDIFKKHISIPPIMNDTFEALCSYFNELDDKRHYLSIKGKVSGSGKKYMPASLDNVGYMFEQLMERGAIDTTKPFLDSGSGDGRVVALTSYVYGMQSVGAEIDFVFADKARSNISNLRYNGIINGNKPRIICGDFCADETYTDAGMRFEDFGTIFNFVTNENDIADKIRRQSPSGTILLIYEIDFSYPVVKPPRKFEGLKLQDIALSLYQTQRLSAYIK